MEQRLEIESEAWYRAVAEGRLSAASDLAQGQAPLVAQPQGAAAVTGIPDGSCTPWWFGQGVPR